MLVSMTESRSQMSIRMHCGHGSMTLSYWLGETSLYCSQGGRAVRRIRVILYCSVKYKEETVQLMTAEQVAQSSTDREH